jgi:hypothetical protein
MVQAEKQGCGSPFVGDGLDCCVSWHRGAPRARRLWTWRKPESAGSDVRAGRRSTRVEHENPPVGGFSSGSVGDLGEFNRAAFFLFEWAAVRDVRGSIASPRMQCIRSSDSGHTAPQRNPAGHSPSCATHGPSAAAHRIYRPHLGPKDGGPKRTGLTYCSNQPPKPASCLLTI